MLVVLAGARLLAVVCTLVRRLRSSMAVVDADLQGVWARSHRRQRRSRGGFGDVAVA